MLIPLFQLVPLDFLREHLIVFAGLKFIAGPLPGPFIAGPLPVAIFIQLLAKQRSPLASFAHFLKQTVTTKTKGYSLSNE